MTFEGQTVMYCPLSSTTRQVRDPKTPDTNVNVEDLLARWYAGDQSALQQLTPLVYHELWKLAMRYMRRERPDHTLQATALVNEAFLKLGSRAPIPFENKAHFVGVAAHLMRTHLIDYAKAHRAERRGGGAIKREYDEEKDAVADLGGIDLAEIDDALSKLAIENPAAAHAMELHYFAGMTTEETADILHVSVSTVGRDIRFARAWLLKQIQAKRPNHGDD